tara:strand:+ start:764 stop:5845 length:5082 start_codon:yes stop_codon:yes gene_type:complete
VYGIDVAAQNADMADDYGYQNISFSSRTGEGVFSGKLNGEDIWVTSRGVIKTLDLLAEGEIDGIVSGEWVPVGYNPVGQIGYEAVAFAPFSTWPEAILRSVYLNDTPIVNANDQYNFQQSILAFSNGYPEGVREGDNFLKVSNQEGLEKTRTINERLRGPDINDDDGDGEPDDDGGTEANPFFYHPKIYRVLNPQLEKLRINLKIGSLTYQKTMADYEEGTEITQDILDDMADLRGSMLHFRFRYRPIYVDDAGFMDLNTARQWYPNDGAIENGVEGLIRSAYLMKQEITPDDDLKTDMLAGWEFEITRITLDSIMSTVNNETYVDSITEVFEDSFSYPGAAMAAMKFNAEYFSQIPTRAYDVRLLKVKVPGGNGGYEPITRTYNSNPWEGTFQEEKKWTDNPAWIFYDILTNEKYGVGKHIDKDLIDKWSLYEISKYCDVLVENGEDSVEPRFTCNVLINTREDAYKVLKDFASIFRSILYYGMGSIHTVQDRPKPEIAQFTNANVEDGDFSYASTSQKIRPTVCLVRYNDKTSFYKPAIEYVEDVEGIRKFGVVEKELTAFACTSRAQAIRLGRWVLTTEAAQSETVNFTVGAEGMLLRPGDIIRIVDENRDSNRYGGRATSHEYHGDEKHTKGITLDRVPTLKENTEYTLFLTTPSYFYDTSLVEGADKVSGGLDTSDAPDIRKPHIQSFVFNTNSTLITINNNIKIGEDANGDILATKISYAGDPAEGEWMFESSLSKGEIIKNTTWTLIENSYASNQYTIISTSEKDKFKYSVQALVHEPNKYDWIEKGIAYTEPTGPDNPTEAPPPPDSVQLDLVAYNSSTVNTKKINITVHVPDEQGTTIGYRIYVKEGSEFNSDDTVSPASAIPRKEFLDQTMFLTDQTDNGNPVSYYIPPRNNKTYFFRAFAINSVSVLSSGYKDNNKAVTGHFPVKDIQIHSLRIASDTPILNDEEDSAKKQFYSNLENKDAAVQWSSQFLNEVRINLPIVYRVTIREVSPNSTPATEITRYNVGPNYFNYTFALNAATTGGPRRHFDLVVEAVDEDGISSGGTNFSSSEGWDIIEVNNPRPDNYWLTPRKDAGKRPGDHICKTVNGVTDVCERITTEQFITSDGLIRLNLINNNIPDLAGGWIYLSKHPFSGADFTDDGRPKAIENRPNIVFSADENYKKKDYQIIEIPFEQGPFDQHLPSQITVSPPAGEEGNSYVFNYANAYYMAVKLYDSYDKEIKDRKLNPCYDQNGLRIPTCWESGVHIGFARDHRVNKTSNCGPCGESTLSGMYRFTRASSGWYVGDYDHPDGFSDISPSPVTGTFSCPIWPTQYYSASAENGFKYWLRVNVNGQWEGNGISHLRVLTEKDVRDLYDYDGYYEYSCRMSETAGGYNFWYAYPNDINSISRCRFRQGKRTPGGNIIDVDNSSIYAGPLPSLGSPNPPQVMTTGATRPPAGTDPKGGNWDPLPKAGIPYGGWGRQYDGPSDSDSDARPDTDKIDSVNWRGEVIEGKSRPLYGFRRFRVYFDPNNLPPVQEKEQLSSYAVVGLNSWNGPYETWPSNEGFSNHLLTAKDDHGVYPFSVREWMQEGDLFENIPGAWDHHAAGFGAGFGSLVKAENYFDIHMGRLIDDSYLNEAFFGVVATNDYSILDSTVRTPNNYDQGTRLHEATWDTNAFVTLTLSAGGDGMPPYPDLPDWKPYPGPGD